MKRLLEAEVKALLSTASRPGLASACVSPLAQSANPLVWNLRAVQLLTGGEISQALALQQKVVDVLRKNAPLGTTSDSFTDIAGCIGDLAVCQMRSGQLSEAAKSLTRALAMCERSHRLHSHLQMCLTAQQMLVSHLSGRVDDALKQADKLLMIDARPSSTKSTSSTSSTSSTKSTSSTSSSSASASAAGGGEEKEEELRWTTTEWSKVRRVQCHLSVATVKAQLLSPEEGLIHLNAAAALVASPRFPSELRPIFLSNVLVALLHLNREALLRLKAATDTRFGAVRVKHILRDFLAEAMPSLQLGLGASIRDIELALFSSGLLPSDVSDAGVGAQASHLGVPFYPSGQFTPLVMGVALLDAPFYLSGRDETH